MTVVKKSRVVNYNCKQMYDLVNDVDQYANFIPYFSSSVVHHRDEDEVQATIHVTAAGISKSFTTRNLLQPNKMIEMRLVDGPFTHLEGFWRFDEVAEGCLISLDLEFELAGRMFSMLIGPVFEQITDKMVDFFCDRANNLYNAITEE